MSSEGIVIAGGLFHLAFAVFHAFFWKLFNWNRDLAKLAPVNRAIVPTMNVFLIVVFLIISYVSVFHASEMVATGLGRSLLALVAILWLVRAVEQVIFFTLKRPASIGLLVAFLAGAAIYATALLAA